MKRTELCSRLQKVVNKTQSFGVSKTQEPRYENIWFVVPPPPPEKLKENFLIEALVRAHKSLEKVAQLEQMTDLDHLISRLLLRHEALSSSRMEGTWSTMDHVLTPDEALEDTSDPAHSSVRGYAHALEKSFTRIHRENIKAFDKNLVCDLHQKIMEKDPQFQGVAGKIRTLGSESSVVFIGGLRKENSTYNPTPPEHTLRCLEEVLAWYRNDTLVAMGDAGMGMILPIRLAVGHSHFEAVHPFPDGNGRVGRMLWPLQMLAAGKKPIYLSGFVEAHKDEYGKALEVAQKKLKYGEIIEFICEAIVNSLNEEEKTRNVLQKLPDEWKSRDRFRKNSSSERALSLLLKCPILTASELSHQLNISFQASTMALKKLVEARILRERTGFGRNRIFAAEEVISVLARGFGEDPKIPLGKVRKILL